MLASQMVVTHALAMEVLGRARRAKDIEQIDSAAKAATKQRMQIRHVHVHAGGQAVVGNVTSPPEGGGRGE